MTRESIRATDELATTRHSVADSRSARSLTPGLTPGLTPPETIPTETAGGGRKESTAFAVLDSAKPESQAGMIRCDLSGQVVYASPWVLDRFAVDSAGLLEHPLRELYAPGALAILDQYWPALLAREVPRCAWHHQFRLADGSTFWGQTCLSLVCDSAGRAVAVEAVISDNCEASAAELALAETRARLGAIISGAPIVIWGTDRDGLITLSEGRGLVSLGLRPGEAVGQSVFDLYRDYPEPIDMIRRALAGEVCVQLVSIGELSFECTTGPVRDAAGEVIGISGVATDVTARIKAEQALRLSEERHRELNAGLLGLARNKHIAEGDFTSAVAMITETAARIMRVARTSIWLLTPDRQAIRCLDLYDGQTQSHEQDQQLLAREYPRYFAALDQERSIRADEAQTDPRTSEFRANYLIPNRIEAMLDAPIRAGGELVGVICHEHVGSARSWTTEDEMFAASLADLVSLAIEARERRRAESEVHRAKALLEERIQARTQELSTANEELRREVAERVRACQELREERRHLAQILVAHERDRQLTAYEIHDGLVQDMTAAQMYLESVLSGRHEAWAESDLRTLQTALELVRQGIAEGRRLITGLRPTVIDEVGLVSAIDYLVSETALASGEAVAFHDQVQFERLDPLVEGTLYRIAQEALTNIHRHSQARHASVDLTQEGDRVRLEVRDDGIGFDPDQVDRHRFGLEGIRERARLLGGQATIDSQRGRGTRIFVDLPLTPAFSPTR